MHDALSPAGVLGGYFEYAGDDPVEWFAAVPDIILYDPRAIAAVAIWLQEHPGQDFESAINNLIVEAVQSRV